MSTHVTETHGRGAPIASPAAISHTKAMLWLLGTTLVALAIYYFVGIDEGASSVFGKTMFLHEFVHDGRHFLGFPCH